VVVVPHDPRGEPVAEEVAAATMPPVEALAVDTVESVHPVRELRQRGLDDEVVVRAHQAEDEAAPALPLGHLAEEREERRAVVIVAVDVLFRDAARRDLEDAARRQLVAGDSGHLSDRSGEEPAAALACAFRHASGTNSPPSTCPQAPVAGQSPLELGCPNPRRPYRPLSGTAPARAGTVPDAAGAPTIGS
jgi:hypothetical protein